MSKADEVVLEAYAAVLHEWCVALQGLMEHSDGDGGGLLLLPAVAGLWAVFLKRRGVVGPLLRQAQKSTTTTRRRRSKGNAGVQKLINSLNRTSASSSTGLQHTHTPSRASNTADKDTPTPVLSRRTTTTLASDEDRWCSEGYVCYSSSKDSPSRAAGRWAGSELHRRSSRLRQRQQVDRVHYQDLLSSEDEDISASSGSDQEYRPHHPRGSHTLTRKVKGGRKDQTPVSLKKKYFGWTAEGPLEQDEEEEEEKQDKRNEGGEKKIKQEGFFPSSRGNCAKPNREFGDEADGDVDVQEYQWEGVSSSSPHHHHHHYPYHSQYSVKESNLHHHIHHQQYSISTTEMHHHYHQKQQQQPHSNTTTVHHHHQQQHSTPNTTMSHHQQHHHHYTTTTSSTTPHHSIKASLPHHSHHPPVNTLPSQANERGTKVKDVTIQKGSKAIKGETHISHAHKGEEGRGTHSKMKEERDPLGNAERGSLGCTCNQSKERHRFAHDPVREKNYKRTYVPQNQNASPRHAKRKRKTPAATTTAASTRKGKGYERVWSPWKVWSLPNMLTLLLTLLYLGVLITNQGMLLMDILRWCRSGYIPFLSAHLTVNRVLRSYVPRCPIYLKVPRVPTSSSIRKATCQMALFLSLQAVPFPPAGSIIRRLVAVLRLPEETATMAEEVVTLRRITQQRREATCEGLVKGEVPGMECQAAAALLVTLKMCCGLNDSSEHHLSVVAARVNGTLIGGCDPHPPPSPLFSFDEWMRYIVEVAWLSKQLDPLCEVVAPPPVLVRPSETKLMTDFARLLTFCNADPAVSIPGLENYPNMRRQLETLDLSLERLCQVHFTGCSAPYDPVLGTLEKYLNWHSSSLHTSPRHQQEASPRLLKRAQQLLQTTFSSTQLLWSHRLHDLKQQLRERGSSIRLKPVKYPHSLCPLPSKLAKGRRHQGDHGERKHTHSLVARNTQEKTQWRGTLGESDEKGCKLDTAAPVNSCPSHVADWLKSNPAGVCGNLQHKEGSLTTSEKDSCYINTQKSCLRDGGVCQCKNVERLGIEEQQRRGWHCIHSQDICSEDGKRCNLKNTKELCVEEKYRRCSCHVDTQTVPSENGKRCDLKSTKELSQEGQHSKGCCHKHTHALSSQNRGIYTSENTNERHNKPMPAEVCRYKEKERISFEDIELLRSDDTKVNSNKRNRDTQSPGFLDRSYSLSENIIECVSKDMNSNPMEDEDARFSLQEEGVNKTFSSLYVPEHSRNQEKVKGTCSISCTAEDNRRTTVRNTDKSASFPYVLKDHNHTQRKGKDALFRTFYPPEEEEDGSQRRNRSTSSITAYPPEGKTGNQRKEKDIHSRTSHNRDKDEDTSSTTSCTSSSSSILAHESLDRLLRGGTSTTALSHTIFVPVPAYRVWQGLDVTKAKWKKVWSGLPRSYRCVVEVLVALCGVTRKELLEEAQAMQKVVEIYSSLLFLFPNPP